MTEMFCCRGRGNYEGEEMLWVSLLKSKNFFKAWVNFKKILKRYRST